MDPTLTVDPQHPPPNWRQFDWATTRHALGNAADVPAIFESLCSLSIKDRQEGVAALHGTLWRAGQVFSATPLAVPHLIEFLATPSVLGKPELCDYLGLLAMAESGAQQHRSRCRVEVERGLPIYLRLLEDQAPLVRRGVIRLLISLCECAAEPLVSQRIIDALTCRFVAGPGRRERDDLTLASVLMAPLFCDHHDEGWMEVLAAQLTQEQQPVAQLVAAATLTLLEGRAAQAHSLAAEQVLIASLGRLDELVSYAELPFVRHGLVADICAYLSFYGPARREETTAALAAALAQDLTPEDATEVATAMIASFFTESAEPLPATRLEPEQRDVLGRLLAAESLWRVENQGGTPAVGRVLAFAGLPPDRQGLGRWLLRA